MAQLKRRNGNILVGLLIFFTNLGFFIKQVFAFFCMGLGWYNFHLTNKFYTLCISRSDKTPMNQPFNI